MEVCGGVLVKSTGIIRKMDSLGRYVIPKEIRSQLNIKENVDYLEVFIDDDSIVLKKHQNCCKLCGSRENIVNFKDVFVCKDCIGLIKDM